VATDWEFAPSSQLGGDSFGYHWIDGDHLALYLLDVCGHGVGAALLSVSMVSVLRNCSLPETDFRDPSSVLAGLNAAFPMERHNDMFCTAWYGVYSLSGKRLRYACGGHPPAVLITAEGVSRSLPSRGPALGIFPVSRYETSLAEIPPESRLYLFSDGAYEVSRPGLPMMDYDGFRDLLATAGEGSSPRTILETVRARHGGGPFEDDFSLVEFRFPETPHHSISSISVTNRIEELERVRAFTEGFADLHGLDSADRNDLHLILEEVVTNVIKYAGLETLEERSLAEQNEACTIALCLGGGVISWRSRSPTRAFRSTLWRGKPSRPRAPPQSAPSAASASTL
jgi:sigma-B regulation protein RsbU (phosphoserine phosphatase)